MNYLTNHYKNKAEQLQEQVNILEAKIRSLNEGLVSTLWNQPVLDPFKQEFKREFTTFPASKKIGTAIANPADTASKVFTSAANTSGKVWDWGKSIPKDPIQAGIDALKTGGKGIAFGTAIAAPLAAGWGAEKATEMGMEALGADPKTPTFTYKRPLNEPDVSTWTTVKPNLTKEVSSAADWGTMSGVAGILSRWLYPAVGRAAPFAAGAILPEIAAGAAAGLAVPPIIYGAYKAGEAISDYMYENDPNRTDPSFEGGKRYRVKMPDGFEYTVDPSARGMPYDPEAAAANKKPTLKGDVKAIGREMATGLETEEPDEEKLKMLKP